jgi:hypothetical protein
MYINIQNKSRTAQKIQKHPVITTENGGLELHEMVASGLSSTYYHMVITHGLAATIIYIFWGGGGASGHRGKTTAKLTY